MSTRCSSTRGPGQVAVLGDVPDQHHRRPAPPWPGRPSRSAHARTWADAARDPPAPRRRPRSGPSRPPPARGPPRPPPPPRRPATRWPPPGGCRAARPSRSARARTWAADSSAPTSSTVPGARAELISTWSRRVDLPTPGSPKSRVSEPGGARRRGPGRPRPVRSGSVGHPGWAPSTGAPGRRHRTRGPATTRPGTPRASSTPHNRGSGRPTAAPTPHSPRNGAPGGDGACGHPTGPLSQRPDAAPRRHPGGGGPPTLPTARSAQLRDVVTRWRCRFPASSIGGGCDALDGPEGQVRSVSPSTGVSSTSTTMVSPTRNSFHRIRSDSGSSTSCWMARRSGRAPSWGS